MNTDQSSARQPAGLSELQITPPARFRNGTKDYGINTALRCQHTAPPFIPFPFGAYPVGVPPNGHYSLNRETHEKNCNECMNAVKNKVQLIGNLGQDPEIFHTDDNKKSARLRVATNETYRNPKGDKVTETQWHDVIAWGKLADIAERYLIKGIEVVVEGKLVNRSYTDKSGVKHYVTEVQANELLILTKKSAGNKPQ